MAYPLQYSCLENSMDRGAWWATVHGVPKTQTQLATNFHFSLSFYQRPRTIQVVVPTCLSSHLTPSQRPQVLL